MRTQQSDAELLPRDLSAPRSRLEPLEERTFLSVVVETDDKSSGASLKAPAVAQAAAQDHSNESDDVGEYDDAGVVSAPSQSPSKTPSGETYGKTSSQGSGENEVEDAPVIVSTPPSTGSSAATVDELLTQTAMPPRGAVWNTATPIGVAAVPLETDLSIVEQLTTAAANASANIVAGVFIAAKQFAQAPQLTARVFSTGPVIRLTEAGAEAMNPAPVLAQAMAIIQAAAGTTDHELTLVPQKHTYRFARLGNPMSLLGDAIARFAEESARVAGPAPMRIDRARAWTVTTVVLVADALGLICYRSRRRRSRTPA